jgi:hypothetical protein
MRPESLACSPHRAARAPRPGFGRSRLLRSKPCPRVSGASWPASSPSARCCSGGDYRLAGRTDAGLLGRSAADSTIWSAIAPSTTTELYDSQGRIIGSFALERRVVVNYDDFAPVLRQAVISIEDKSFESHWGINVLRIAGAIWHDLFSHGRAQGASTLTMQLARNLFLSSERTADAQAAGGLSGHPDRARLH